jgi:hypothetical protein
MHLTGIIEVYFYGVDGGGGKLNLNRNKNLKGHYRYGFTFLYVDDIHTSQETHLRTFLYVMFVPHRKHTYGSPRPVTGIALLFISRRC